METEPIHEPIISLNTALDILIGLSSHDSQNQSQRDYGKYIYEQYIPLLLESAKDNPRDYKYIINLIGNISGSLRGFSVVRSIYGGRVKNYKKIKNYELQAINRLIDYSPLSGNSIWGKIFSTFSSIGLSGLIATSMINLFPLDIVSNLIAIIAISFLGIPLGTILIDILLTHIWRNRVSYLSLKYPESYYLDWQKESGKKYKHISYQFLVNVIQSQKDWYGISQIDSGDESKIFELIEKHFPLLNDK